MKSKTNLQLLLEEFATEYHQFHVEISRLLGDPILQNDCV